MAESVRPARAAQRAAEREAKSAAAEAARVKREQSRDRQRAFVGRRRAEGRALTRLWLTAEQRAAVDWVLGLTDTSRRVARWAVRLSRLDLEAAVAAISTPPEAKQAAIEAELRRRQEQQGQECE